MAININRINSNEVNTSDVLSQFKLGIFKELKCASLGIVKKYDEKTDYYSVEPFPLIKGESVKNIQCYAALDVHITYKDGGTEKTIKGKETVSVNDMVLIVFLDRNYFQNFRQVIKEQKRTNLNENSDLHSDKYGLIIKVVKHF